MKALVVGENKSTVIKEVPIPKNFLPYQILVKVAAVAANPTDWKHIDFQIGPVNSIIGCDAAGTIVKLGKDETEAKYISETYGYKVGDYVTALCHGCSVLHPENGAFAEYILVDPALSNKFEPKNSDGFESGKGLGEVVEGGSVIDSFEKAASLPVSLHTAVVVLATNFAKKIEFDDPSEWQDSESTLLIYGGATGFAQYFLQINQLIKGFKNVVTIASSKHESLLKSYGVLENFDYKSENFLEEIIKKYPNIVNIMDAVSTMETFTNSYETAKKLFINEKVQVVNLMNFDVSKINEDKRDESKVAVTSTLLYSATGLPVPFGPVTIPADPHYRKVAVENIPKLTKIINNGSLKSIPIKIQEKAGLEGAAEAIEGVRSGKNSGEKFVARF
ncbi:hypothetical protein ACO0R3_001096 [Hanseniaspora guilliermondii]